MQSFTSRCVAVAVLVVLGLSMATAADTAGDKKLRELQDLKYQGGGIVTLTDGNFNRLVLSQPRPYKLLVLLTARHPGHRCSVCMGFESEFQTVASSFDQHVAGMDAEEAPTVPTFFAVADFDTNHKAFKKFKLQTVPFTFYFGAASVGSDELKPRQKLTSNEVFRNDKITAEDLAIFVRQHTGIEPEIVRPVWPKLLALLSVIGIITVTLRLFHRQLWSLAMSIRNSRILWFAGCVGIYFIAVSGIVFDIIRTPPPFMQGANGAITFFHPQSNQQFVFEGLIIGGLNVVCAVSAVVLATYVPHIKDAGNRQTAMVVCSLAFVFTYMQIVWLYQYKAPWYSIIRLLR